MTTGRTKGTKTGSEGTFPSLTLVVTLHSLSLLGTLILGIILFLFQTSFEYYIVALFLTGPIYAVNLYYLTTYIEFIEDKVKGLLRKLNYERQKEGGYSSNPLKKRSKLLANDYLLNKFHSETGRDIIDRKVLYIAMFTPIWPLTFYYALYKISSYISAYESLLENYAFFNQEHNDPLQDILSKGIGLFETSLKHKVLFSSFALISVIGFTFTFYLISAGFFALFWVVLLHQRLSGYIEKSENESAITRSDKEEGYITGAMILAFLCFGATSGFIAMFSNTIYLSISSPLGIVNPAVLVFFVVSVIAPLVEEPAKVAGLFLLDKDRASGVPLFYWVFFGLIAGFGFALIENYSYFQSFFLRYSTSDSLYLLLMRFSFPVHMIGSSFAGLGIGLWRKKGELWYLLLFTLLAVLVHGTFNFIVTLGGI